MPEQNPQPVEIPQEVIAKFHSFAPEKRQEALAKMAPETRAVFLPAAQEYKAMHAPDSAYKTMQIPGPTPSKTGQAIDKVAQFTTRNAPTIAGGVGGVLGGLGGGIPGAVVGAAAGGAYGGAVKSGAEKGKVSAKDVAKDTAEQAAFELAGGLAGKGILKTAKLLGVDEALMKFALKRGEDFQRELNPAAMMNKYHLHAMATKELYNQTVQKIGTLNKTADAMVDQVAPYSSTVRPYAIVKSVLDKYKGDAAKVGDDAIQKSMTDMLDQVGKEFNNAQTGAQGAARAAGASSAGASHLPTDRLLTTKEANQLKQVWGDSVQWGKEPPKDSMQAAFKAVQNARRDIYHALNDSIADAMGGNQGKTWKAANHDIFNLMEAKGALQEAGERTASDARGILPTVLDSMRKPGAASVAGQGIRNAAANLGQQGVIPSLGRGASLGADAMLSNDLQQNPIPVPNK